MSKEDQIAKEFHKFKEMLSSLKEEMEGQEDPCNQEDCPIDDTVFDELHKLSRSSLFLHKLLDLLYKMVLNISLEDTKESFEYVLKLINQLEKKSCK